MDRRWCKCERAFEVIVLLYEHECIADKIVIHNLAFGEIQMWITENTSHYYRLPLPLTYLCLQNISHHTMYPQFFVMHVLMLFQMFETFSSIIRSILHLNPENLPSCKMHPILWDGFSLCPFVYSTALLSTAREKLEFTAGNRAGIVSCAGRAWNPQIFPLMD